MNLTISKHGNFHVIQSDDIDTKQRFFEWASFGTGFAQGDPEYYGKNIDPREPPPGTVLRGEAAEKWALTSTDDFLWEWRLTDYKAKRLLQWWEGELAEGQRRAKYLNEKEELALQMLVAVFKKMLG